VWDPGVLWDPGLSEPRDGVGDGGRGGSLGCPAYAGGGGLGDGSEPPVLAHLAAGISMSQKARTAAARMRRLADGRGGDP
jgi:hypothetical protein